MFRMLLLVAVVSFLSAAPALAAGGDYVIEGGTSFERQQVSQALDASSFDWSAVPQTITITIAADVVSQSSPGRIWLDASLLDAGEFSWGVVQNEYAHQVDFFLLDDVQRSRLTRVLGAAAWCYADAHGLTLADYGCERFASTLAVAYWPTSDNCISDTDAVAAIAPAAFRAVLFGMIGNAARPMIRRLNATRSLNAARRAA